MLCIAWGEEGGSAPAYLKRNGRWGASGWVVQVCFESAASTLLLTPGFLALDVLGGQQSGQQRGFALGRGVSHARHALKPVPSVVVRGRMLSSSAVAEVGFSSGRQEGVFCAAGAKFCGWGCCDRAGA